MEGKKEFIVGDNRKEVIPRIGIYLRGLDERRYSVKISLDKDSRTLKQNRAYWGVWLKYISEATGQPPAAWHEYFKTLFTEKDSYEIEGEVVEVAQSTTGFSVKRFSEYIENVHAWCAEQEIILPPLLYYGEDVR